MSYHRARFLAATAQKAMEIDLRSYVGVVCQPLHDIRHKKWNALLNPDSYEASKTFARELRSNQSWGIVYPSVRDDTGQCVAVFRPQGITVPVKEGAHIALRWDGKEIVGWYKKSNLVEVNRLSR